MSFPIMNAGTVSTELYDFKENGGTSHAFLATITVFPIAPVPGVVDVSGMELHFALLATSATGNGAVQALASGASTMEFVFGDGGTTATADPGGALLEGGDLFSNTVTGGYTLHQGVKGNGTSATDLDADDWVLVQPLANATAIVGAAVMGFSYLLGKPGAIA